MILKAAIKVAMATRVTLEVTISAPTKKPGMCTSATWIWNTIEEPSLTNLQRRGCRLHVCDLEDTALDNTVAR